jgi:hypothetical protein
MAPAATARQRAQVAVAAGGWYHDHTGGGHVCCPECPSRICTTWYPHATPRQAHDALVDALAEHIQYEHEQAG